ncbi:MAG: hypothetical protein HY456_02070, partial [Parcubacteria group bacterium]|nr:hypothetical protein [Parcubacteria group bacterium]
IDVDTVDPVYTIGGAKFATYMATMTGVKEETAGVAMLRLADERGYQRGLTQIYEYVIDFNKVERGSDLWLFWQATDFGQNWDKLTALLTAGFDGKVWYEKDPQNNRLTILGSPTSLGVSLEVSYRLTAPRFDHAKWPNTSDSVWEGLVIPEK